MQQNGDTVAGKKIEVIIKDDGAVPDNTKRLAQELIVNDKVNFIAGFGVTPAAMAAAPLATEAQVPQVVMAAGTSIITERSPYIVRTSFTLAQSIGPMGEWAARTASRRSSRWSPTMRRARTRRPSFKDAFVANGGEVIQWIRVPLANPDFAPFLQRAADAKPDAIFVFVPSGQGARLRQAVHRARPRQGRHQDHRPGRRDRRRHAQQHGRPGDRHRDGAFLFGRASVGREQDLCRRLQEGNNVRPNFMAVGGYDGMHLIYEALKKTSGKTDGDSAGRRHEGHDVGKPARPDLDRSGYPRHHPEHLYPQGRED